MGRERVPSPAVYTAAVAAAVSIVLSACGGSGSAAPTTPAASTATRPSPTSSPSLTANQRRCIDEAGFLLNTADPVMQLVLTTGGTNGDPSDLQATIDAAQQRSAALQARPIHSPWGMDRDSLIRGMTDLIAGYQGIVAHHVHQSNGLTAKQLATRGIDEISSAQTDIQVKRATCAG